MLGNATEGGTLCIEPLWRPLIVERQHSSRRRACVARNPVAPHGGAAASGTGQLRQHNGCLEDLVQQPAGTETGRRGAG